MPVYGYSNVCVCWTHWAVSRVSVCSSSPSPELVQSEPYTEKVDIWAAGCLLYLMAMLHAPFKAANPLALATKVCVCGH